MRDHVAGCLTSTPYRFFPGSLLAVHETVPPAPRPPAGLLYGAGLRVLECCHLRVQDVDFAANQLILRGGKGDKDRVTMLPATAKAGLVQHLEVLLNHIGVSLLPSWEKTFRRRPSPEGKLALISSQVSFPVDSGRRPFQAPRILFEFRHQLAHGVTQDLPYESAKHWLEYGAHRWPAAAWEVLYNAENAASLVADTEQMIETLFRISGIEPVPTFLISEHIVKAQHAASAEPPGG